MKSRLFYHIQILIFLAMIIVACEDAEPPTVKISALVDEYTVTFSADVTNTDSYTWNFGDGTTSSEAAPVHTYDMSGTYTVTLMVSGDGGQASDSESVNILPSFEEMLSGGSEAINGKTWILSRSYTAGVNGGGVIDNDMWVMLPSEENALDVIGMGQEYDNEFTFYHDGTYVVDIKNDTALTATLFGIYGGEVQLYTMDNNAFGLNMSSYEVPENATWTLHDEDLVVTAVTDPLGNVVPAPVAERTISDKKWISLSEGAYFGILDFPTTRKFVIKELTPDKMEAALFICAYWPDPVGSGNIPTYFFHLTFEPKD